MSADICTSLDHVSGLWCSATVAEARLENDQWILPKKEPPKHNACESISDIEFDIQFRTSLCVPYRRSLLADYCSSVS